jgi:hypothetical protein
MAVGAAATAIADTAKVTVPKSTIASLERFMSGLLRICALGTTTEIIARPRAVSG